MTKRSQTKRLIAICLVTYLMVMAFSIGYSLYLPPVPASGPPPPLRIHFAITCDKPHVTLHELSLAIRLNRALPSRSMIPNLTDLRWIVRIESATDPCRVRPLCRRFGRLTDDQIIGLTDLAAQYPFRFGTSGRPADQGAVIDPTSCHWGFGRQTPMAMVFSYALLLPTFDYDVNCGPKRAVDVNGQRRELPLCPPLPGTN